MTDVHEHARAVAERFLELHPGVDDVDDLAQDAALAVSRWAERNGSWPTHRRGLALMRSELFRRLKDRPR